MAGQTSPPSLPISLFDILIGSASKESEHGAVDLIQHLLKLVGYEACQAKRNVNYLCSAIFDFGVLYGVVHKWIDNTANTSEPSEKLRLFKKYTDAIYVIEEYASLSSSYLTPHTKSPHYSSELFELSALLEEDSTLSTRLEEDSTKESTYPDSLDLEDSIRLVKLLADIRDRLGKAISAISNLRIPAEEFTATTQGIAAFVDDYSYLLDIKSKIKLQSITLGHKRFERVLDELNKTEASLKNWCTSNDGQNQIQTNAEISLKGVQFWMLVHLFFTRATAASQDSDPRNILNSRKLWDKIFSTAAVFNTEFETPATASSSKLEGELNAFIAFLEACSLESEAVPESYKELYGLAGNTGRFYFGWARSLVEACADLEKHWNKQDLDGRDEITEVFTKTKEALQSAVAQRTNTQRFDVSNPVNEKLEDAQKLARTCFVKLEASMIPLLFVAVDSANFRQQHKPDSITAWETNIRTAKARDDKQKEKYNAKVANINNAVQKASESKTTRVYIETDGQSPPIGYDVDGDMSLGALLWHRIHESRDKPLANAAKSHFVKKGATKDPLRLDSDMKIREVLKDTDGTDTSKGPDGTDTSKGPDDTNTLQLIS
ncbi:hypothetical protein V5O48_009743 [Marasmius crinis-equi]|uniref:Uncharacterized protein n=1 Tax=Marasmius crinis-equi TaxID=585013 RepID=A0ABR3FAH5_9AGAR